eukprot:4944453-Pyramimonas_sp.AAC.1
MCIRDRRPRGATPTTHSSCALYCKELDCHKCCRPSCTNRGSATAGRTASSWRGLFSRTARGVSRSAGRAG